MSNLRARKIVVTVGDLKGGFRLPFYPFLI